MTPGVKVPASIKRRSAARTSRQVTSLRQWLQGVLGSGMVVPSVDEIDEVDDLHPG